MTTLYNCRHAGDEYRISKFNSDFDVESSYLCTESECECPAGHRPICRHREMLPKFIQRGHVGDEWFFDYDRGGWIQGLASSLPYTEISCPGHVAGDDPKICARCGTHIDSLRPEEELSLKGITFHSLNDPLSLHNAIAEAIGEPEAIIPSKPSPSPTIRRRI